MVVFHDYPAGTLVSYLRAKIKKVVGVSAATAESSIYHDTPVSIGNLAMQGGPNQSLPRIGPHRQQRNQMPRRRNLPAGTGTTVGQ
jgi:hypothetical protein